MKISLIFCGLFMFAMSFLALADEVTGKVTLSGDLASQEWMPTKNGFPNITYSPLCKSDANNSQKRVRLLKDTNFLFRNLKAGDVLFGVASIYQAKTYTIRAVAYCKPELDSSNGRNHKTCLYDFNNDGVFDDRSDNPARITKAPSDDFTKTKYQYPYEVIDFDGEKESITTCVAENDTTWTADYKQKDAEKKAKSQEIIGNLVARHQHAKENSSLVCVGEKECKKYFQLTQIFITDNSSMKIQVATDTIIETYNPTELYKIGMKASKYPGKGDSEKIVIDVVCKSESSDDLCIQKETKIYEKFRPFIEKSLQ